jgi:hypothetical protein
MVIEAVCISIWHETSGLINERVLAQDMVELECSV